MLRILETWAEVVEVVGPVDVIYHPSRALASQVLRRSLGCGFVGLLLYGLVHEGLRWLIPRSWGFPCCGASTLALLPLAVIGIVWNTFRHALPQVLRWRVLLGRRGIALWQPGEATCILWEELGVVWLPVLETEDRLVLRHESGWWVVLTSYFEDHASLIARIRGEQVLHQTQEKLNLHFPDRATQGFQAAPWTVREPGKN